MLISKDENIKNSIVYIGYLILKELEKNKQVSIFNITKMLKKTNNINYRQLTFSLLFLYSSGIINFEGVYISKHEN